MGLHIPLVSLGRFHYIAHFNNGLIENEVDHVLFGLLENQPIQLNPEEVEDYRWVTLPNLMQELKETPSFFTPWLSKALPSVIRYLHKKDSSLDNE
jgi:diphosphomevalonate decarboxylase